MIHTIDGGTRMKKISLVLITVLILYIMYYDLTTGTLPLMKEYLDHEAVETMATNHEPIKKVSKDYYEITIKPGDTVLSIIEKKNPSKHVEITKIIQDFKELNPKANPEKIQIGKTYKFPRY